MAPTQTLILIDGQFTAEMARSTLVQLLQSKINYHSNERFSNEIRYGNDVGNNDKYIKELNEMINKVISVSEMAQEAIKDITVRVTIDLSLSE